MARAFFSTTWPKLCFYCSGGSIIEFYWVFSSAIWLNSFYLAWQPIFRWAAAACSKSCWIFKGSLPVFSSSLSFLFCRTFDPLLSFMFTFFLIILIKSLNFRSSTKLSKHVTPCVCVCVVLVNNFAVQIIFLYLLTCYTSVCSPELL